MKNITFARSTGTCITYLGVLTRMNLNFCCSLVVHIYAGYKISVEITCNKL